MVKLTIKSPFGFLAILNLVLLPLKLTIVVRDYLLNYPDKMIMVHLGFAILAVLIFICSIVLYTQEIVFNNDKFMYKGRRVQITEGDIVSLNFIRKPCAFILQFFLIIFNSVAIMDIFGLK